MKDTRMNRIILFVLGLIIGFIVGLFTRTVPAQAIQQPLVCATQCIASECGTSIGTTYELQSSYEYADGICPLFYHWQNEGNWQQRCHKNFSFISPAFVSPIGCPAGFSHVGDSCRKTIQQCNQVSCDTAEVVSCPTHSVCREFSCVSIEGEGESTCESDKECEQEPTITPTPIIPTPTEEPRREPGPAAPPVCSAPAVTTAPGYSMGMMDRVDADTIHVSWTITDGHAQKYGIHYGMSESNLPWYTEVIGHETYEALINEVPSGHVFVKICNIGTCGDSICGAVVDP